MRYGGVAKMYYIFNDAGYKKNFNPYKEALKELVKQIKNTEFDILINTNIYIQSQICADIDKLVLKIYSSDNINYNALEKDFKKLYKKYGVINLLNMYVVSVGQILDSYLFNRVVSEDKRVYILEDMDKYYKSCSLLATIALFSIIINNDLLNYKIDYIIDNKADYKIVKDLKRESISLGKGLYDVPIFITTRDAKMFRNSLEANSIRSEEVLEFFDIYSVLLFQAMAEMVFFKDEYKKYFKFTYEYDIEALYYKRIFSIDHNVIRRRKVLPPKDGVILRITNDKDVESIYLTEKDDLNSRAVAGVIRYTNGMEEDFIFLLSNVVSSSIFCTHAEKVFGAIMSFYEVECNSVNDMLNKYGRMEFEIISPYYWKYRKSNYETSKEREQRKQGKKVKREYTVNISSFIRRINGSPSKEAQQLAEKLCVRLEPNHTIVKEHKRTYNRFNSEDVDINKMLDAIKALSDLN